MRPPAGCYGAALIAAGTCDSFLIDLVEPSAVPGGFEKGE